MVIYRPDMRGNYEKSMERAQKFATEAEMLKYIEDVIEKDFAEIGAPKLVPIKAYIDMEKEAADERNGWLHTRLLKVSGYPGMGSNNIHLGYADVETFKGETI